MSRPTRHTRNDSDSDSDHAPSKSRSSASLPKADPKADALVAEAEKKLKGGFLGNLLSGSKKYEDACELYLKAAAQYKITKNWSLAGDCYVKAADLYRNQLSELYDASTNYVNAAKAYKNVSSAKANRYFQSAVEIHMESNRFSTAAKLWKDIAELYEKDLQLNEALLAYQKSAECYEAEDSQANASAMNAKVAQLYADQSQYKRAIEVWERLAKQGLESSIGRWSVKDYLFKCLLCHLVLNAQKGDVSQVEQQLETYKEQCPQLDGTRESKLITDVCIAFKDDDVDGYTDVVFKYDEIYKLDNWTAKVLLEVKNALKQGGKGGLEDEEDAVPV